MRSTAPTGDSQPADSTAVRIVGKIGADRPARVIGPRPAPEPTLVRSAPDPVGPPRHAGLVDAAVCAMFVLAATALTAGLWRDPATRMLAASGDGQTVAEWFLAYDARTYAGDFGLVTDRLNAPDGINLLANPALVLLGVLLAPVTLALGAPVSFAVATTLGLGATAAGWHLLLARTLRLHRFAAALGGLVAGFTPGIVAAAAGGQSQVAAQWLVPPVVWCVLRLAAGGRPALIGSLLGFLLVLQYHLDAEVLLITGTGLVLTGVAYAVAAWPDARHRLPGLGTGLAAAVAVAGTLLAYPVWIAVAGPQHVPDNPYPAYAVSLDVAGLMTLFGIPLLLVVAGITLWLWRRPVAVACTAAAGGTVLLAFGPALVVGGGQTAIPGPYALLDGLPGFTTAQPGRFALAAAPLIGVLVALAVDTALAATTGWHRFIVPAAVLTSLIPVAPAPLPTDARPPVPRYFTSGLWKGCAADGRVLVPVPPPAPGHADSMRWAAAADAGFSLPEGSFVGPYADGGRASLGTFPRPTSLLLAAVADTGRVPPIGAAERAAATGDVAFWRARCFVLAPREHDAALRAAVTALVGAEPERVADVWVWRLPRP